GPSTIGIRRWSAWPAAGRRSPSRGGRGRPPASRPSFSRSPAGCASGRSGSPTARRLSAASASRHPSRGRARARSAGAGEPASPPGAPGDRGRGRAPRRDHRTDARPGERRGGRRASRGAPCLRPAVRGVPLARRRRATAGLPPVSVGANLSAVTITDNIRARRTSAREVVTGALERIDRHDRILNCFTRVLSKIAIADADRIDRIIATGGDPGPLAGVPFAVKNLFDVAGVTTVAGSRIHAERPPATRDATAVAALRRAGAVLVGCLNMDEYAFGFTTENTHYGPTRNPHDLSRIAGGSSGGSAAAVAAGLVPLSLGSDTNGSIPVPAALCGGFGLQPTYPPRSTSPP